MPLTRFLGAMEFDAARLCEVANNEVPQLHGHGFRLEVLSDSNLISVLTVLSEKLNLSFLNDLMEQTDNLSLASWLMSHLPALDIDRLQLSSGTGQGVTYLRSRGYASWFRSRFESAHYLPSVEPGHKCGRLHGHGFEVQVHAAHQDIHDIAMKWEEVYPRLHHQLLNNIPGLANPTSEMLAQWLWHFFAKENTPVLEVTVFETRSTGSVYNGTEFYIWKDFSFDSATILPRSDRVIGHTYTLRVGLNAPLDEMHAWVEDFGDVKAIFNPLIQQLDHQPLHQLIGQGQLSDCLQWLQGKASVVLPKLARISLWETPHEGMGLELKPLTIWAD